MCTLIMVTGMAAGQELFVIANRDEQLDRPAETPTIHIRDEMRILAPKDLKAGGTWIGINEKDVFAGITNRFGQPSEAHHRSRGELAFMALESETAKAGAEKIAKLSAKEYNGFHLTLADASGAYLVWNDREKLHFEKLTPGYHLVTERSFDAAPSQRLTRLEKHLSGLGEWSPEVKEQLKGWLRVEDDEVALEGTCICKGGGNYGTRSSTLVELGDVRRFAHADGPPCATAYEEYIEAGRW